jgi:hypothetical protein
MQHNFKKCTEMQIDFRKLRKNCYSHNYNWGAGTQKSKIIQAMWLDDDLKWTTNAEYITKKGTKRLYFMKILKSYNSPTKALKAF